MNALLTKSRIKMLSAIALAGVMYGSLPAVAYASNEDLPDIENKRAMSKEAGITTGSVAVMGAIAGGPPGFVIGAMIGALIGDNVQTSNELDEAEVAMNNAAQELNELEQQIVEMDLAMTNMEADVDQLEEVLLTRLEFQVLFRTGDDQLRSVDQERIAMLAKYLERNPALEVRLEGHTDVRGTEEYNNLLAEYRARAVAGELMAKGIVGSRIFIEAKGSAAASATPGDYEGYAMDRRVNIEVAEFGVDAETASSEEVALVQ